MIVPKALRWEIIFGLFTHCRYRALAKHPKLKQRKGTMNTIYIPKSFLPAIKTNYIHAERRWYSYHTCSGVQPWQHSWHHFVFSNVQPNWRQHESDVIYTHIVYNSDFEGEEGAGGRLRLRYIDVLKFMVEGKAVYTRRCHWILIQDGWAFFSWTLKISKDAFRVGGHSGSRIRWGRVTWENILGYPGIRKVEQQ